MTIVDGATAPAFEMNGARFTGLAAPSRGARETATWRVRIAAGTEPFFHRMTREEIIVAIAGKARFHIDGEERDLAAGGCAIVPSNTEFALSNPHDAAFEGVVILPVGGRAMIGGTPFDPPWAA